MTKPTVTLSLSEVIAASGEELRELALSRLIDEHAVDCQLPTQAGEFRAVGHATAPDGEVTVALIHGRPGDAAPVRTHVHCLLGDTFGSQLCNCHADLQAALAEILAAGAGVLVYVKPAGLDPLRCPSERVVDPALVGALLRHVDVLGRRSVQEAAQPLVLDLMAPAPVSGQLPGAGRQV